MNEPNRVRKIQLNFRVTEQERRLIEERILSHLLLKGMKTTTFLMEQDLFNILLVALAIYSSLTIAWQMYLTRRKET